MKFIRYFERMMGAQAWGSVARRKGKMDVSGHNILDEHGNPWVMRGFNYGHGEIWNPQDPYDDVAMGCNTVRIIPRRWGPYTLPTTNGEQAGAWGDWSPAYIAYIIAQVVTAKAAGLKVNLAFDSNCGQNGWQGYPGDTSTYTYCSLSPDGVSTSPGQNYFTALGIAQKVPQFLNGIKILIRTLRGMVDFVEPLVEPNPSNTGNTQLDVNNLTVQVMNTVLAEDPDIIFILGGFSYQHGKTQDPLSQSTNFPSSRIVLTCDLLDNIMTQPDATYAAAVTDLVNARTQKNRPVVCQQAGTSSGANSGAGDDWTGSILADRLERLRTATNGSIGWTFWERVSKNPGSYGPWWDPGDGSGRQWAANGQARLAVIQAALTAAPIYPT
jgi:hypothetical protein